jgi:hypothetical protein
VHSTSWTGCTLAGLGLRRMADPLQGFTGRAGSRALCGLPSAFVGIGRYKAGVMLNVSVVASFFGSFSTRRKELACAHAVAQALLFKPCPAQGVTRSS